jgi:hypothetical protein
VRLCARGSPSWSTDHSSALVAYSTSRTSEELSISWEKFFTRSENSLLCYSNSLLTVFAIFSLRFGSGLSLQAKVKMSPPPVEPTLTRSGSKRERLSFRRSSSRRHRQHSTSEEPSSTSVVPNTAIPEADVVQK